MKSKSKDALKNDPKIKELNEKIKTCKADALKIAIERRKVYCADLLERHADDKKEKEEQKKIDLAKCKTLPPSEKEGCVNTVKNEHKEYLKEFNKSLKRAKAMCDKDITSASSPACEKLEKQLEDLYEEITKLGTAEKQKEIDEITRKIANWLDSIEKLKENTKKMKEELADKSDKAAMLNSKIRYEKDNIKHTVKNEKERKQRLKNLRDTKEAEYNKLINECKHIRQQIASIKSKINFVHIKMKRKNVEDLSPYSTIFDKCLAPEEPLTPPQPSPQPPVS
jgi:Mg2+ and Co2+ transporter CorA